MDVFLSFPESTLIALFLALLALGACAGVLAGLLGIGGGLVLVPGVFFIFTSLGMGSDSLMHVCVGTALSTIIFTGMSSARAHWKRGAVDFDLVKLIGVGIVFGTIAGSALAAVLDGRTLLGFFSLVLFVLAYLMAFPLKVKTVCPTKGPLIYGAGGGVIGTICTLMGIGGGALSVPFMCFLGAPIHRAVGTASALGVVVAVPAVVGFIFIGWDMPGRPPFSFGYVNVLVFCIAVSMTVVFAPLGAALAHRLPVQVLRKVFAIFLVIVAIEMGAEFFK